MAYNVTEKFRTKVYSGESLYSCILTINDVEVPYNQIESIKISSPIIDKNSNTFYIGTFISQSITIKFKNLDGLDIKSGNNVDLQIGQYIDSAYEYVPIGKFLIDDLTENYQTTCEITCMDYAVKMKPNIDYSAAFDETGLISIDDLLHYICEYFGVELGTYPDINGDIKISTYDSSISGKQYISYIAEIKGSNAKFGRDGKLYLQPLKTDPVYTINALSSKTWELSEKYEITNVIYEDAVRKFAFGDENLEEAGIKKNTLFIRTDNMFIVNGEIVETIYNNVKGFKIYSLKCENFGDVSLDSWDIIRYQLGVDENDEPIYYDTLNNNEITYAMTVMSTVDTKIPTVQQESTVNVVGGDDSEQKLRIMRTEINQQTGDIKLLTEETTRIQDNLNENYYDIRQTNQLIQNASEGLTNTFSEAGGNNVFRNTGLWFEGDSDGDNFLFPCVPGGDTEPNYPSSSTYLLSDLSFEYWTGYAAKTKNDESISGNSFILQTGIFYQEAYVPNGNYSISFMYKKLINLAVATVKINEHIYKLTSNEWKQFYTGEQDENGNYIVFPIEVTSGKISIEFSSNSNNSVEIYDLMCNKGTTKLAWSQNENETTTDTVNISKGITITSNKEDVKFKANADGVRIVNKNNEKEIVTKFTDKGMETNEAKIRNQAEMCGTLVQEVGEQTWFTRM